MERVPATLQRAYTDAGVLQGLHQDVCDRTGKDQRRRRVRRRNAGRRAPEGRCRQRAIPSRVRPGLRDHGLPRRVRHALPQCVDDLLDAQTLTGETAVPADHADIAAGDSGRIRGAHAYRSKGAGHHAAPGPLDIPAVKTHVLGQLQPGRRIRLPVLGPPVHRP